MILGGLPNGTNYFVKTALIDEAGNSGFYTPAAQDQLCDDDPNPPLRGLA